MKILVKTIIVFSLLLISIVGQGQAQDVTNIGVQVGDTFKFKVTKNDFTASSSRVYLKELVDYYNISDLGINSQFDFTSIIEALNETMTPSAGNTITVSVTELPTMDSLSGKVNVSFASTSKEVLTGFLIGTPVTFADWNFWKGLINDYNGKTYDNGGISVVTELSNNTETFNTSIVITLSNIPSELSSAGISSLKVTLEANYNATSGVLNDEIFKIALQGSGTLAGSQTFSISRSANAVVDTTATGATPGFELVALIGGMIALTTIFNKKREIWVWLFRGKRKRKTVLLV